MRFELTPNEFGAANVASLASMVSTQQPLHQVNQWKWLERQLQVNPTITKCLANKDAIALLNYSLRSIDKSYRAPCQASDRQCAVVYIVIFG